MAVSLKAPAEGFGPQEPLCEELAQYVEEREPWGKVIRHPLVYTVPYFEPENHRLNLMLTLKREAIAKLEGEGNWAMTVWFYERPYRLDRFVDIADRLGGPLYWSLLGSIWTGSENIWQNYRLWRTCFQARTPRYRSHLMDATPLGANDVTDRRVWRAKRRRRTPHRIYRGWSGAEGQEGMSWTTNHAKAVWFARRFRDADREPHVVTGLVDSRNIIAYFNGRGEEEIVAFPEDVVVVKVRDL